MSFNSGQLTILPISKEELADLIIEKVAEGLKSYYSAEAKQPEKSTRLLKIEEVCMMLRVSKPTIHKWKKTGRLPFHRISNKIYFKESEILASIKIIDATKFKF